MLIVRFLFVFKQVFGSGKASGLVGVLTVTDEAVPISLNPLHLTDFTGGLLGRMYTSGRRPASLQLSLQHKILQTDGLVELLNNTLKDAG